MTVVASAVGPLLFAWGHALTGTYAAGFYLLSGLVVIMAIAAATVRIRNLAT